MTCLSIMTWFNKMKDLLYSKGKMDNKHILLNEIENKENDENFTILVSIIK